METADGTILVYDKLDFNKNEYKNDKEGQFLLIWHEFKDNLEAIGDNEASLRRVL